MHTRFASFILTSMIAVAASYAAAPAQPVEVTTDIFGGVESGDRLLLSGFTPNVRYSLKLSDVAQDSPAYRAIEAAINQRRLLTLTIDLGAAHLDGARENLVFPLCGVRYEEISAVLSEPCPRAVKAMQPGYMQLAEAVALSETGRVGDSLPLYNKAIDSGDLDKDWRLNALELRANSRFNHAFSFADWSDSQDRLLVAALADFRLVDAVRPTPDLKTRIASVLSRLGAYDEALEEVADSADPADPEQFQLTITAASIARLQGKPEVALDMLNALRARLADSPGMKFHYHRGRTLMQVGRLDEAVADFTAGIESQPDYSSAIVMRGCAHAALGEIKRAKEDFRAAQAKIASVAVDGPQSETHRLVGNMTAKMEWAERSGKFDPDHAVCVAYIDKLDSKRNRSPYLPPRLRD